MRTHDSKFVLSIISHTVGWWKKIIPNKQHIILLLVFSKLWFLQETLLNLHLMERGNNHGSCNSATGKLISFPVLLRYQPAIDLHKDPLSDFPEQLFFYPIAVY